MIPYHEPNKEYRCERCGNMYKSKYPPMGISLPDNNTGIAIQASFSKYWMMSSCPNPMPLYLCEPCVDSLEQLLKAFFDGT